MNCSLADARSRVLALETVAELRTVLDDIYEETAIRHVAAQRLGQIGEAGRIALQEAFAAAKENPPGRVAALQALVRYFPKESEATLLEALDDPWPRVRRSAYILLRDKQNLLAPLFRLRYHLPAYLWHNPAACEANLETLSAEDQVAVWEAIGKAHFLPGLPKLISALAGFDLTSVRHRFLACSALQRAIREFGAAAMPLIVEALRSSPKAPDLLFQALALMDIPSVKKALISLQNTTLHEKATHWLDQYERRIARRTYWAKFPSPKTHPIFNPLPVPKEIFEIQSRQLFSDDLEMVHHAIETLKYQANPDVGVLFWVLADDPRTVRGLRQKAHNSLEFWRRYNGRGKR